MTDGLPDQSGPLPDCVRLERVCKWYAGRGLEGNETADLLANWSPFHPLGRITPLPDKWPLTTLTAPPLFF